MYSLPVTEFDVYVANVNRYGFYNFITTQLEQGNASSVMQNPFCRYGDSNSA